MSAGTWVAGSTAEEQPASAVITEFVERRIAAYTEELTKIRSKVDTEQPTSDRYKRLIVRECELTGMLDTLKRGRS